MTRAGYETTRAKDKLTRIGYKLTRVQNVQGTNRLANFGSIHSVYGKGFKIQKSSEIFGGDEIYSPQCGAVQGFSNSLKQQQQSDPSLEHRHLITEIFNLKFKTISHIIYN